MTKETIRNFEETSERILKIPEESTEAIYNGLKIKDDQRKEKK